MKTVQDEVTVKMTGIDGKEVTIKKPVSFPEYESTDDVLTALQNAEVAKLVISALNYGSNLKARAKVTQEIKQENQGPEVAINRAVKQLVANRLKFGKPLTEDEARVKVMANLEAYGIEA